MMEDEPDLEIRKTVEEPPAPEPPPGHTGVWVSVALLIAAAFGALYFSLRPKPLPPARPVPASAAAPAPVERPLGGVAESIVVPPLDQSDAAVRSLVRALSSAPPVVAWLATNDLIRNFTVVVANIAEGATPRRVLQELRPASGFQTIEESGVFYVDPRGYARYDGLADAVDSIDPAGAASVYATLKPRITEAYQQLGLADPSFDHTLERAIVALLRTPVVDGRIRLVPKGIGYAYADDRLENLTAAQKQLLRMGPRNTRLIESKLRAVALALGIPPDRLPRP